MSNSYTTEIPKPPFMEDVPAHPSPSSSNPASGPKDPPTLSPFMTLPPELRTLTYIHYFTPLLAIVPASLHHCPALLTTTKQIRHEALPIYYQHSRFVLELPTWDPWPNYPESSLREQSHWLENLAPHFLASINRLQLRVYFSVCDGRSLVQAAFNIDLNTASVILRQVHKGEEIDFVAMGEKWEDLVLPRLSILVREIAARKGPGRLTFEEFIRFEGPLIVR